MTGDSPVTLSVTPCLAPCDVAVDMALEELVYEIVETNSNRRPDETFDVRIIDKEAVFTVVLKSKGPLRNPIYKYSFSVILFSHCEYRGPFGLVSLAGVVLAGRSREHPGCCPPCECRR